MDMRSRLDSDPAAPACIWRDHARTYDDLRVAVDHISDQLTTAGISSGDTVAVVGDYSPNMIAMHLALIELRAITVPLPPSLHASDRELKIGLARADWVISMADDDTWVLESGPGGGRHHLIDVLVERGHAGFVVFTSGTTGQPKAVLHDFAHFLRQFENPRRRNVTLAIFAPDHLAGLTTLFYTLCTCSCLVCVPDRSPSSVCAAIERHRVQFLPTSPTFLKLLLLADAHLEYDLTSLQLVTFGSEPMHDHTLERLKEALPATHFHQVYGISEINNLRAEPRAPGSNWLRLRQDNYDVKIKNGTLWVKTSAAMLGYLNAPSPFDADGWFDTGDVVQTDGEFIRVLGRDTDIINVGGDKVHPAEVEDVIMMMPGVRDATVYGRQHPITGQVVAATVVLDHPESLSQFKRRLREHCARSLPRYKVPVKIELSDHAAYSARFKKTRGPATVSSASDTAQPEPQPS